MCTACGTSCIIPVASRDPLEGESSASYSTMPEGLHMRIYGPQWTALRNLTHCQQDAAAGVQHSALQRPKFELCDHE